MKTKEEFYFLSLKKKRLQMLRNLKENVSQLSNYFTTYLYHAF